MKDMTNVVAQESQIREGGNTFIQHMVLSTYGL